MEAGVLVLTNFTYTYGSKVSAKQCGQWMTFNPSSLEELDELKFILDSSYLKRGFLYLEDSIKEDFKNKTGVFIPPTQAPITEEIPVTASIEKELVEEAKETEVVEKLSLEDRKVELTNLTAAEVKKLTEELGIEYINKTKAIEAILNLEYPGQ